MPYTGTFVGLTGLLSRSYWVPIENNIAHTVERRTVDRGCKEQCRHNEKCCHWGVRAVKDWQDAQRLALAKVGGVEMAWEIDGPKKAKDFEDVHWCKDKKCDEGGKGVLMSIEGVAANQKLVFNLQGDGKPAEKAPVTKFPKQEHGTSFYVLAVLKPEGYVFYDKEGTEVVKLDTTANFVETLKQVSAADESLTWVKAWVCGLFDKTGKTKKIREESEERGILPRCLKPHESVVDEGAAKELVTAKIDGANKEWSDDFEGARAGNSRGITFASIACAVFASVSLIYVILAVKNSRLQVSAEE